MTTDLDLLKQSLLNKSPLLLIGAGFSLGSYNKKNDPLPTASNLAKELFLNIITKLRLKKDELEDVQNNYEDLRYICRIISDESAVKQRNDYLTKRMSGCHCDKDGFHMLLKEYPWRYIFSLNIDDLVEYIYSGCPLSVQINNEPNTGDSDSYTTLIKLHGSVSHPDDGYIFDDSEYRHFSSTEKWSLTLFGIEFIRNDVIFIGTEFQEDDLLLMIDKFSTMVNITKETDYFFVAPKIINRTLRRKIECNPNMYHICMKTDDFLYYIKDEITDIDKERKIVRDFGMVFLDEQIREMPKRYPSDIGTLYFGGIPRYIDFIEKWDIPYPYAREWIQKEITNGNHRLLLLHGEPYVGKSCVAMRAIVDLHDQGYLSCSFPMSSSLNAVTYTRIFKDFLEHLPNGTKCAVLTENMPYHYAALKKIVSQCPTNIKQLIIIATGNTQDHNSKKYILDDCTFWEEHKIIEHISQKFAENIYNKLREKNHLNKLLFYASNRKECIKFMKDIDDIVDVLFIAQEGRRFIQHFDDWLKYRDNTNENKAFAAMCLLADLGVYSLSASFFSDIMTLLGIMLNYDKFIEKYSDYLFVNNGSTHIRCLRIIRTLIPSILTTEEVKQLIIHASTLLATHLNDREDSFESEMFQKLIKVKTLRRQKVLKDCDILDLLVTLENPCEHLSYYWIQRGIINRELTNFEEANNAFSKAADIRGHLSYHVQHAQAKNYMEWGIWEKKQGTSSHAQYFFNIGKEQLRELIWHSPHRYFAYSVHTYVDMSLKYCNVSNQCLSEDDFEFIIHNLKLLIPKKQDSYMQQIIKDFTNYCMKAHKQINDSYFMDYISKDFVSATDVGYDVDEFGNDIVE
jgi:hypothetical protein